MRNPWFAVAIALATLLSAIPFTGGGQATVAGLFLDQNRRLTGAAAVSATLADDVLSGTATIANQTLTFSATHAGDVDLDGTLWKQYKGSADVSGRSRPFSAFHNAVLGAFIGEVVKPDISGVVIYSISNPGHAEEIRQALMENRSDFSTVLSYDLLATPDLTLKVDPPGPFTPPLEAGMPMGIASVHLGPIDDGIVPQAHAVGQQGSLESRYGPRNQDHRAEVMGGMLQYQIGAPMRDDRYHGSFDEVKLGVPNFKHLTLMAWSPSLATSTVYPYGTLGVMRMETLFAPHNWNLDPNPVQFYSAKTFPTHGHRSAVSLSGTFSIGFGPLSLDVSTSYVDPDGVRVELDIARAYVEVDWRAEHAPGYEDQAIGAHLGLGAIDGADGNYLAFSRIVASYYQRKHTFDDTAKYMLWHEMSSSPTYVETGLQASLEYTKASGKLAAVRDYDVGDRATTASMGPGMTPGYRTNSFSTPWPGQTTHVYTWYQIEGPICKAHDFRFYVQYFKPDIRRWVDVDVQTRTVQPPPGTCLTHARLVYDMLHTYTTSMGHYQVYLSEVPRDSTWREDFLDVADFHLGVA